MLEFIRDAGYGIFPVMACGAIALVVALRYAARPERRFVPLLVGFSITTLIMGAVGSIIGVQTTIHALAKVGNPDPLVLLEGVKESLNNFVAACMLVALVALVTTVGSYRRAAIEETAAA